MTDTLKAKSKAHTIYKTADGRRVPGVTTIIGILDKPALVRWANNLGLEGIDSSKYTDGAARIGTLAHNMVQCYLSGETCDTSDYSKSEIDQAENALIKFWEWEKCHTLEPILIEQPLVSEEYRFGGTIDCLAMLDGELTLVDFKTGKGIYDEMGYQLAAYVCLLKENGYDVKSARIIRIGRDETEGFEERMFGALEKRFEVFKNCLNIYNLKKELKAG